MISLPLALALVVVTWIFSAGFTYGFIKSWRETMEQRLDSHASDIEKIRAEYVPRAEHRVGNSDIRERLERIERKIDYLPKT